MNDHLVSIAELGAWLAQFETLLVAHEVDPAPSLARGMTAVLATTKARAASDTVGERFTAVGMALVGSASGAAGPLYGTLFLRFGMNAGAAAALDAHALGRALRAGYEGAVERGTAAVGNTTLLDALGRGVDAYDAAIAGGADAATAASAAFAAADSGADARDGGARSVTLLLEALATALRSS